MIGKIRAELEREITNETQVVFVMVKVRKLLDLEEGDTGNYLTLRLCCNWCIHTDLSFKQAGEIIKKLDQIYPAMVRGSGTFADADKVWIREIFSFERFRDELAAFFAEKDLPALSDLQWHSFLKGFLDAIEDAPLWFEAKGQGLANVDEVMIYKEGRDLPKLVPDGPPPITWALLHGDELVFSMGANTGLTDEYVRGLVEFEKRIDSERKKPTKRRFSRG
jgi:hypothetical protein